MKKSITFKGLCLAIAFTVAGFMAQAQLTNSFYLNGAFPIGEFGKQTNESLSLVLDPSQLLLGKNNIGHNAIAGFGFGYRAGYRFDVGVGNVDGFISGDLFWNRIDSETRDNIIQKNGTPSQYINIPILLGVQYSYAITEALRPFAEFGIGYDFMFISKESYKILGEEIALKYRANGTIAFQIGAGCYFGEHVSAGINFYGLGKHAINYKDLSNNALVNEAYGDNVLRQVNVLALRIGFHF